MSSNKTFKGYAVTDLTKWSDFTVVEYPGKTWEETDVEIAITHCGVCGSDVHMISSGWGGFEPPLIVGHEIVGIAVRVGSKVEGIKVGDRVGVGAQIGSDYTCRYCTTGYENFCAKYIYTYGMHYPDGVRTQGGWATGIIANALYVFPIPDAIQSADAASMLCAGLTMFAPLIHNGAGPGKKVGIVGIGGLGHYGILFAKALGCEVYAFSHSTRKASDAQALGADHFVNTSESQFYTPHEKDLDLIISTVDNMSNFHFEDYLSMLVPFGKLISVGVPETNLPSLSPHKLIDSGAFLGGSRMGSKRDAMQMLALAAEKGVKPWIEVLPMKDLKKAVEGLRNGHAHYRYVLTQDISTSATAE